MGGKGRERKEEEGEGIEEKEGEGEGRERKERERKGIEEKERVGDRGEVKERWRRRKKGKGWEEGKTGRKGKSRTTVLYNYVIYPLVYVSLYPSLINIDHHYNPSHT